MSHIKFFFRKNIKFQKVCPPLTKSGWKLALISVRSVVYFKFQKPVFHSARSLLNRPLENIDALDIFLTHAPSHCDVRSCPKLIPYKHPNFIITLTKTLKLWWNISKNFSPLKYSFLKTFWNFWNFEELSQVW